MKRIASPLDLIHNTRGTPGARWTRWQRRLCRRIAPSLPQSRRATVRRGSRPRTGRTCGIECVDPQRSASVRTECRTAGFGRSAPTPVGRTRQCNTAARCTVEAEGSRTAYPTHVDRPPDQTVPPASLFYTISLLCLHHNSFNSCHFILLCIYQPW